MNNIAVGILTKNRPETFQKTLNSIPKGIDIYVLYAEKKYPQIETPEVKGYFEFNRPTCISWCKNHLLRMMINDGHKHLFLIEDDIEVIDPTVFEKYIEAATKSGILSLSYKGYSKLRNTIDYDGIGISFAEEINRSFVYYPKSYIKTLGFFDERYDRSTIEHIDLTYRFCKAGILPPFGWFADLENSDKFLSTIPHTLTNKTSEEYKQNYWYECNWFKHKYGNFHFQIKPPTDQVVLEHIEKLKNIYGK
jgi:hypothetical protein